MQLKVEINGEESLYSFDNNTQVRIGRSPDSDIQILVEGISRNHAQVIEKNGEFIYTDLGSSVGSFVNDEPLQANIPTVFNSFFPIRLGESVFLYLVDEVVESDDAGLNLEEIPEEPLDETPSVEIPEVKKKKSSKPMIYVPESAGTVTKDASRVLERKADMSPRKARKKVTRKSTKKANVRKNSDYTQKALVAMLVLIVAGFFGYKKWEKIEKEKFELLKVEMEKKKAAEELKKAELEKLRKIAKEKELEAKKEEKISFIKGVVSLDKCLGEIESKMCYPLKQFNSRSLKEGYYKTLSDLYLVLDIQATFNALSNLPYEYKEEEKAELFKYVTEEVKGGMHLGYFENQKNFMISEHIHSPEEYKFFLFSDFILSGGLETAKSVEGITTLTLIAMNLDEYNQHIVLDFKKLQELSISDVEFLIKLFVRSDIKKPLRQLIQSIEFVPSELTKNL